MGEGEGLTLFDIVVACIISRIGLLTVFSNCGPKTRVPGTDRYKWWQQRPLLRRR